jgi:hypothetical protein
MVTVVHGCGSCSGRKHGLQPWVPYGSTLGVEYVPSVLCKLPGVLLRKSLPRSAGCSSGPCRGLALTLLFLSR